MSIFKLEEEGPEQRELDNPQELIAGKYRAEFGAPEGFTDRQFREIVGAAYTAYTSDRVLPSVDRIKELCALTTISKKLIGKALTTEQFKNAMLSRGVPWKNHHGLTGQQMYALQILTDPTDRRELGRKLKSIGITHVQYRAWLRQPAFSAYLANVSGSMLQDHIPDFTTALTNKALAGDLNAIKYAFEISGHHDPDKEQVLHLQVIMQQLIEIITRNVKDPAVLSAISNELHLTLVGQGVIKGEITHGHVNPKL